MRVLAVRPTAAYFARTRSKYSLAVCGEIPIFRATATIDMPEAYRRKASDSRGLRSGVSMAADRMEARSTDKNSSSWATVPIASASTPKDTRLGTNPSAPAPSPARIDRASS